MSFGDEMAVALAKKMAWLDSVRKAAIHECCSGIIDDTPVASGDLKGSWHTRADDPTIDDVPRNDATGDIPKQENYFNLGDINSKVYFTNGLPYSEQIEFDGKSKKAPEGMVRKNLAKFKTLVAVFRAGGRL